MKTMTRGAIASTFQLFHRITRCNLGDSIWFKFSYDFLQQQEEIKEKFHGYIKELVLHPLPNHQVFTSEFFGDKITPDFMLHLNLSYHYAINFGGSFEANSPYG